MELVPHLWEALKAGPLDVVMEFHPPLSLDAMDRKQLAEEAEIAVRAGQMRALCRSRMRRKKPVFAWRFCL